MRSTFSIARIYRIRPRGSAAAFGPPAILLAAALLTAAALLQAGCSRPAVVRSVKPEFTAEMLRQGRLAVLGVVQKDEIALVRRPLTESLERVLTAARKDIPLVAWNDVLAALDDSTERFLLLGYQYQGFAEEKWLRRAADSLRAAAGPAAPRYGILARVESERVRYAERDVVMSPAPGQPATDTRLRVAGRDVNITAVVYDLTTLEPVMSGKYAGFGESAAMVDSLPPREQPPTQQGWSTPEERAQTVPPPPPGSPPREPFPEPPPLAKAAEAAFTHLAGSLPGAEPAPASTAPR